MLGVLLKQADELHDQHTVRASADDLRDRFHLLVTCCYCLMYVGIYDHCYSGWQLAPAEWSSLVWGPQQVLAPQRQKRIDAKLEDAKPALQRRESGVSWSGGMS